MRRVPVICVALMCLAGAVQAQEQPDSEHGDFAFYAGQYSSFRSSQYETGLAGIEYRWADQYYGLRPTVGVWGNGDGAWYGYGGIYWDLELGNSGIFITPGVAAGAYRQGDSKDLGSWFEFRDTLEISYRFDSGQRLGAQITHMSNAGIGSDNPGVEMLQAVYTHPIW